MKEIDNKNVISDNVYIIHIHTNKYFEHVPSKPNKWSQ